MLHSSKEVVNSLRAGRSQDKVWCQWIWALLRDSLLSEHIGMISYIYSMVNGEIGLKLSVMNVGNWVIAVMNAQGNNQAENMPLVLLAHSKVLLFCCYFHLRLLIWCQKSSHSRGFPFVVQC